METKLDAMLERARKRAQELLFEQTTIELSVLSPRFGVFRKSMKVENANGEFEQKHLKAAADILKAEMEKWCTPKMPDPVNAALARIAAPCPGCGGMPTCVRFMADDTVCMACWNMHCKAPIHTNAYRLEDDMAMLAEWNHLCMVANEDRERTTK